MADYGRIGWRTTVLIVAVALAVVVGMIILGNTDSDSRPRPRPSVSGPPSMSTLVFATWGSDEELDAYQQIVEDYNRTSTVVDVRVDGYADPQTMTRMSPAALLGRWHDVEGLNVYRPYLASAEPFGGLDAISSPAPEEGSTVNWLNIFYAVEWAVFAGFAFYLWYRLAKDAWEKELEDFADADTEGPDADGLDADGPDGGAAARG